MDSQAVWQRRAAVIVWLVWMAIMFQFSTQLWNSTHTKAILEWVLSLPVLPEMTGSVDLLNFGIRKAAHLTEYMVLATVGYGAMIGFGQTGARALQLALGGAISFAISDEWHQRFVASRTSTPQDVLIDISGACLAIVVIALWQRRQADRNSELKNSTSEDCYPGNP
ncbi:MAG: VanZ family protein [Thermosynechococcaceae cyanobacterium]